MTDRPRSRLAKVATLPEMEARVATARDAGCRIALVHGEFEVLHAEHVRHLEMARDRADFVVVVVVADQFVVQGGPERPVFPDHVRAEMVASLEAVDGVVVSEEASPEWALERLRPDVFVLDASDDGSVHAEASVDAASLAESHGAELLQTDGTNLGVTPGVPASRFLRTLDPTLRTYLDDARQRGMLEEISELFERVADMRVLIVGDAIVDEYRFVVPSGKSVKENMIAALFQGNEIYAGGVFAAANHLAGLCKSVELVTALGSADSHEELIRSSLRPNVRLTTLMRPGVPTTRKSRYIDTGYSMRKLFEVYYMDDTPLPSDLDAELRDVLAGHMDEVDLVIVTDFGHGLLGDAAIQLLMDQAPFLAVNAQSNSANFGYNLITRYGRADYICIDGPEARLAIHDKFADLQTIAGEFLPKTIDCDRLVVTQGKHGCVTFDRNDGLSTVPALTQTIVDTVGAGDAFFVVTAPLVAAGADMRTVGFVGNAAGALKVGIVGHRAPVEKADLVRFVRSLLA